MNETPGETKARLRVGVIGAGDFAEVCHLPGLQSHDQADVVALCGHRYEETRAMADRHGIPEVFTDFRELCAHPDLDAVTIATQTVHHLEPTVAACDAGLHVFCEKPLAMTLSQARQMLRSAEASGKVHMMSFTFRYGHAAQELRRRVRSGDIGEPYYLRVQYDDWDGLSPDYEVTWRDKKSLAGGGRLYDLGSHLFDIARFALGPIETVTGFLHNVPRQRADSRTGEPSAIDTDDLAAAWFRHRNGVRGQWFVSRVTPPFAERGYLEVIGPEGALKAGLSRGSVDYLKASSPQRAEWEELPLPEEAGDKKPHSLGRMMRSFVDACLSGKLGEIDASFDDGVAAQLAIEGVLKANEELVWVDVSGD